MSEAIESLACQKGILSRLCYSGTDMPPTAAQSSACLPVIPETVSEIPYGLLRRPAVVQQPSIEGADSHATKIVANSLSSTRTVLDQGRSFGCRRSPAHRSNIRIGDIISAPDLLRLMCVSGVCCISKSLDVRP